LKKLILIFLLSYQHISNSWAHGEDKLGPHQGFIRMPGAFHVELVQGTTNNRFFVYLMDVGNKNPIVNNSSVSLTFKSSDSKIITFICRPKSEFFDCNNSSDLKAQTGTIIVKANRNGAVGKEAEYPLPLQLTKIKPIIDHDAHKGH
jgi:hypothetical protein